MEWYDRKTIVDMKGLEDVFKTAIDKKLKYIAVVITTPVGVELIVFERNQFEGKLQYYKNTYFDSLNHKYSADVKILAADCSDYMEVFELLL